MKNKLLSISIPTYNNEKFLKEVLDNIVKSSKNYEDDIQITIVDDGSTDNTATLVSEFINKYDWINYIYQKNTGLSGARNTIVKNLKAKFLWMLDADDLISLDSIESIVETLKNKPDTEVINFGFSIFYNDINKKMKKQKSNIKDKIFNFEHSSTWHKVWKKELLQDIVFPVGYSYEDVATTFLILNKITSPDRFVTIKKTLLYYRINPNSIMRSLNDGIFDIHHVLELGTKGLDIKLAKSLYQVHLITFHSFHIFNYKGFSYKQKKQEIKKNLKIMKEKFGKKALKIEKGSMSFRVKIGFLFIKFHLFFLYKILSIFSNRC